MAKLLSYFMGDSADCAPFLELVNWRRLKILEYPKITKKPMDLGTVKKNLNNHKYATAFDCAEDNRLVWSNCKQYNADGSEIF